VKFVRLRAAAVGGALSLVLVAKSVQSAHQQHSRPFLNGSAGLPVVKVGDSFGVAGESIVIDVFGIGGDWDANSGWNVFRITGGGLDFTWGTGKAGDAKSVTYALAPTPVVAGPNENARGLSYVDVNLVAAVDASLERFWRYHDDFDDLYTYGFDQFGNFYDDSASFHSLWPLVASHVTRPPPPFRSSPPA